MRLIIVLILIAIFNVADYFYTNRALAHGIKEGNILVNYVVNTPLFPLIKLGVINLFLLIVYLSRNYWKSGKIVIWSLVLIVFVVYGSTCFYHAYNQMGWN